MRPTFSLFQSHLDFAHTLWKTLLSEEDCVVDATCGNGYDARVLAGLAPRGTLFLFDIQEAALKNAAEKLKHDSVSYHQLCHSKMDEVVPIGKPKLIVFNLGYLPGHDKALTTQTDTTLVAVEKALSLVCDGGAVSITCYPGHEEGKRERDALYALCRLLDPKRWSVSSHAWINRNLHPELIFIQNSRK